jgi:hypothetical protein
MNNIGKHTFNKQRTPDTEAKLYANATEFNWFRHNAVMITPDTGLRMGGMVVLIKRVYITGRTQTRLKCTCIIETV